MLGLAAALAVPAAERAQAFDLFDAFRGLFRDGPPQPRGLPRLFFDPFGGLREGDLRSEERGPHVAYCVRLCDGRYFPLPASASAPQSSPEKLCSALCPAAKTRVFSGGGIENAVAADGSRYANLEKAFLYREQLVSDCSCNGREATGLASIDALSDPTLRPGDVVVTAEGPVAFKGDRRPPHQTSDFVPAADYKGLPESIRRALAQMRVAREARTVTAPAFMAPPAPSAPPLTFSPQANVAPELRANPVSEAHSTFQR
jgi:hypothetical protein